MPTKFEIPAKQETHCEPCEHHKCTGALYTRMPGCGAYREYECRHPSLLHVIGSAQYGRMIGKTEKQPEWCPLKTKQP